MLLATWKPQLGDNWNLSNKNIKITLTNESFNEISSLTLSVLHRVWVTRNKQLLCQFSFNCCHVIVWGKVKDRKRNQIHRNADRKEQEFSL